MTNRRDFLAKAAAAGGLLALSGPSQTSAASKPLRVLVLGGTGNIGPYFVRAALDRGHQVSVFVWSKEKDKAQTPPGVQRLLGDREGDLASIVNRDWDAVLDIATFVP